MLRSMSVSLGVGVLLLATMGVVTASATGPNPNSHAQITVVFSADCTDFVADSSKDISFVETYFASGAVVKDESMTNAHHSYVGVDLIASVVVKSGTTKQTFTCEAGEPDPGPDG